MNGWDPEDYARHSAGQEAWARELLSGLNLRPDDRVLDIGCGDGRITAELAKRVPFGGVVGVDFSEDMIRYAASRFPASAYRNLEFRRADAGALPYREEFTVIYSNAALHWVRDHRPVLAGIARALRPGGRCRMQMGGKGNAAAIIASFEAVTAEQAWRDAFERFESPFGFHAPDDYRRWLGEAGLKPERVQLFGKDMVHADREAFEGWFRTAWPSHTGRVPSDRRARFIEVVAEAYLTRNPPDAAGRIHVAMVRLQVEAHRAAHDPEDASVAIV
jgi:trans-aconitate 2-methyltransferase